MAIKDTIIEKYKSGIGVNQIARDINCSKSTVSYHINNYKLDSLEAKINNLPYTGNTSEHISILETDKITDFYRYPVTIKSWRNALYQREQWMNNFDIYNLYREVWLDSHIKGVMNLRKSRLTSLPFIITKDGVISEELHKLFDKAYFHKFLGLAMNFICEGISVIEFLKFENNVITELDQIPLKHLIVEKEMFIPNPQVTGLNTKEKNTVNEGIYYNQDKRYEPYTIEILNSRNDLGCFADICPLYLWKRTAFQCFSVHIETFSQPIRVGKTSKQDIKERKRIFDMLKQMGSSLAVLLDQADQIEIIQQNSGGDPAKLYTDFIKIVNEEISKLLLGGTLIVDQGGSRAQGTIHAGNLDSIAREDAEMMRFVINDKLIPKMQKLNLLPVGNIEFKFDLTEQLSLKDKWIIDKDLSERYGLDKEYIEKKYNTFLSKEIKKKIDSQDFLAITNLNTNVTNGLISRDAAINMLTKLYHIEDVDAESMITDYVEPIPVLEPVLEPVQNTEEVEQEENNIKE